MSEQLADDVLRNKGLVALEKELGAVHAIRFLAMISRQPFDYQKWRQKHFEGLSLAEILKEAKSVSRQI